MSSSDVLALFKKFDESGDGTITKDELKFVLKSLDAETAWTEDGIAKLLAAASMPGEDKIRFEELIKWLFVDESSAFAIKWGEWMGAWKAEAGQKDEEQDRLDRQNAAFGGETSARIKDLNVLIIGCRGVGIETAKNLILSNVGSVSIWDPEAACVQDLSSNFYLSADSVGKSRAAESLGQLKSLNPYCKVEAVDVAEPAGLVDHATTDDVLSTGRGYSVVVVTTLLPQDTLFALNAAARGKGIAFILAVNTGVTTSFFSDFGPQHTITDSDGEPTQMLAVSAAEVIEVGGIVKVAGCADGDKVVVLTLASDHTLADGDLISLDDMRGDLAGYNQKQVPVKRLGIVSPSDANLDMKDTGTKEMLKRSTGEVLANMSKQFDYYKSEWEKAGSEGKFKTREITLFNRICLVLKEDGQTPEQWSSYQSGGLVNSVKATIQKEYSPLEKALKDTPNPQMMDQEAWVGEKGGDGCWIQVGLAAALKFQQEKGKWPGLRNEEDATEFVEMAKAISESRKSEDGTCWLQTWVWGCMPEEADKSAELKRYSLCFQAELTGFCAYLGGVAAQEVIKKTGKFAPVDQWVHHDDVVLYDAEGAAGDFAGTRYEYQASVLGSAFMEQVRSQKIFLVGCGALGCEYLKGLALMGACTSPDAKLIVTDMDRIEVSNLSRQFLFRQTDVGNPKSSTAARVVKGWNPELQVEALEKGVGTDSEDFFNDAFWGGLNLCWNALDNVLARKYTDRCCLWYNLPLLESGTLGTKSNSDVFLPTLTKSYNDGTESDANENQIAMCTLRSFPYLPIHCIEFAKQAYFADYMEFAPTQYEAMRKDKDGFFEQLEAMSDAEQFKALKLIKGFIGIQSSGKVDFDTCIKIAFDHYCKDYITSIRDLVWTCDQLEKSSGKPFWTGTKRRPKEAPWDPASPPAEAMEYLYATANCYAFIWKVPYVRNRDEFTTKVVALRLEVPAWSEPAASGSQAKEGEEEEDEEKADPEAIFALKGELHGVDTSTLLPCDPHDFEKDDDTNYHIDFLTTATNMRAGNYDIKKSERAHVKVTAGRIIPALATSTAMICGLVDLEFMKLVKGLHKTENPLDKFYNANINLATGNQAMNVFRPEPAIKLPTELEPMKDFTSWDKVEVPVGTADSVKALVEKLAADYGATIVRLYPLGNDKVCLFDKLEVEKMDWKIEMNGSEVTIDPEAGVFGQWPNLRMAVQNIARLPEGNARKMFESQVNNAIGALQKVKDSFEARYNGSVKDAFVSCARPSEDDAKQAYFDTVLAARTYLPLEVNVLNAAGEEARLPHIKYCF